MATVYAATLRLTDALDDTPAGLDLVADLVSQWAEITDGGTPQETTGRRGAWVKTTRDKFGESYEAWELTLAHTGEDEVTWIVTATAIAEADTDLIVRLDRSRQDGIVMPMNDTPAPPGCIRQVLEGERVRVVDASTELTYESSLVSAENAEELAGVIMSPDRRIPVVGVTPRDHEVIDAGMLLTRIAGLAHVALVKTDASWRLDKLLPYGFNVYGGAVRVWWPGVVGSSRRDHPLWTANSPARRVEGQVARQIIEAGIAGGASSARLAALQRRRRTAETAKLRNESAELRKRYETALAAQQTESSSAQTHAGSELAKAEAELLTTLERQVADAEALAEIYSNEVDGLREQLWRVESERDHFKSLVIASSSTESESSEAASNLFTKLVEEEIEARGPVDGASPRPFKFGHSFDLTLSAVGEQYKAKVIKACADVVSNAPSLLARRGDHRLRAGEGANDPVRVRSSDGAEAHRCYIERNTPSARRLHYWVLPESLVEFASVNVHEDMTIPE